MALQRTSVGIDIGAHAIKVVELRISEKGAFIQNALSFDHANLVARGVDPQDRPAVADLLASQMSETGISTRGVVLGISGGDSILRYTAVPPVPAWRLKVIMDYEIGEVAEKIGEPLASDYRVLSLPREAGDDQIVLVGLCKEASLGELLDGLESAGILVARAMPAPLALFAALEAFGPRPDADSAADDLTVAVDIGRHNVNSVLVLNGRLAFARSVRFGGDSFTEALANDLGVDHDAAEEIKERSGTVDLGAVIDKRSELIVNALRGAAAQLQGLIQSSLRFARSQVGVKLPEPTRILLVGGGSRLGGLPEYLEKSFRAPVSLFHPTGIVATGKLEGEAAHVFGTHPGDFSVAIGLAVSGIREGALPLNILPAKYTERRRFRERTLFLIIAGALLAANLLFGLVTAYRLNATAHDRGEALAGKLAALESMRDEMEETSARNAEVRGRLNRIIREVEATSFQAFLLDYLQRNLRAEAMLQRVTIDPELDEEEADLDYTLVIEGTADNANGEAVRMLEALEQGLNRQDRVASARFRSMDPAGTTYEFVLLVKPAFQTYRPF